MSIESGFLKILDNLDIGNASMESFLAEELGVDSQEMVSILTEVEKLYGISLTVDSLKKGLKVRDMVRRIEVELTQKQEA